MRLTMNSKRELEKIYVPSENVVAREIDGEMIIVPLTAGIGNMEDELYTLNETGKAIWKKLDGNESLGDIVSSLSEEYRADEKELEEDVVGLITELRKRLIIVEKN
jgi:hypothetical protein